MQRTPNKSKTLVHLPVFSKNCLRELDSATEGHVPLVLVHETDVSHGGTTLNNLRTDCRAQDHDAESLFDEHTIIPWHRVGDFQQLSLRMIAERMLLTMPNTSRNSGRLGTQRLFLSGELISQTLEFRRFVRLYVSDANPGATTVVEELLNQYKSNQYFVVELRRPREFVPNASKCGAAPALKRGIVRQFTFSNLTGDSQQQDDKSGGARRRLSLSVKQSLSATAHTIVDTSQTLVAGGQHLASQTLVAGESLVAEGKRWRRRFSDQIISVSDPRARARDDGNVTHSTPCDARPLPPGRQLIQLRMPCTVLLYLNQNTFVGEVGKTLEQDVRMARSRGVEIVLTHENDPELDGCTFDRCTHTRTFNSSHSLHLCLHTFPSFPALISLPSVT